MNSQSSDNSETDPISGVGTDIIEIQRIREAIERHGDRFLDRIFTTKEKEYCLRYKDAMARFAGRFAAKEAVLKSFGTGLQQDISWKEIEVLNDPKGKPEVHLSPRLLTALPVRRVLLSISHCEAYATATALVVR